MQQFLGVPARGGAIKSDDYHLMRLAAIYTRLHDSGNAFKALNRAFNETPTKFAYWIDTDPSFDSLRSDQRWAALINRPRERR